MAPSTKPLSLICLSTLLFMISPHLSLAIRESHFFNNNKAEEEPSPMIIPESRNGYGLYGRHGHEEEDYHQLVPATLDRDTRYGSTDFNAQFPSGVYATRAYERGEYPNEQYGMSDTRYLENGKYFYDVSKDSYVDSRSGYGYAGYSNNNNNNNNNKNGYEYSEPKGQYGNQGEQGKGNEGEYVP
ncbi:hypothetical protein QJS10_CPB12g00981 [Acorus calamus]|uniref:Uncharacterized protein n=1 Tax=Acorus calamus TaxID=4465 RepID=A0AAV9DMX5_ACOCL|nr:hypothetical protein QJS10_CPB12g00981 [Acorus calamus]